MKNYLVVGASSGIGKELVSVFNREEYKVYGTYRNTPIQEKASGVEYHFLDVTEDTLNLDFLPDRIDGLAYCPGTINLKPFARIKPEDFIDDFNIQVLGAVKGLVRAPAAEFVPKIRVNCIAPSITYTPLSSGLFNSDAKLEAYGQRHPMKRVGSVQDIAQMAAFLLSDKSKWITGQVYGVDGGIFSLKVN